MESLTRINVGDFSIDDSFTLLEIENSKDREKFIISIEKLFENNDKIELEGDKFKLFINGGRIKSNFKDGLYRVYFGNKFIGLGDAYNNILRREIVLN